MEPRIRVRNASFRYEEHDVFSDLSVDVYPGEVLSILGPNGCGKTTLLRCLNGALKLRQGTVYLNGRDIATFDVVELARKIGFLFQDHTAPFPFSVIEVVRMGRAPYLGMFASPSARDTELAEAALEKVGMLHIKNKPYTEISGGERQLILLARTLAQEPEVILLDEPTSHLDFKNQSTSLQMINLLAKHGITMIMTTHNPNHALLFPDTVAMMSNGRFVATGKTGDVVTEENLIAIYGIEVKVFEVHSPDGQGTVKFCSPWFESSTTHGKQPDVHQHDLVGDIIVKGTLTGD